MIYKFTLIVLLTFSFFGCDCNDPLSPVIGSQPDYKPMWPQAGYNGRHTSNRNTPNVNIPPVNGGIVQWIDTIQPQGSYGDGTEAAIDSKGNIYHLSTRISPTKGQVIKFRPDGTIIWQQDSLYIDAYFGIALSADETKIYYQDFTHFSCRDSSGALVWSMDGGGTAWPVVGSDGTIYTSYYNHLCAFTPSGVLKWSANYHSSGILWPSLDIEDNLYVYNRNNAGTIYELLKISKNGELIWSYPNLFRNNEILFSAVIDGYNNIYFRGNDSLISVDKNGKFRWSKSLGSQYISPSITSDNKIIIEGPGVVALDTAGNTIWVNNQIPASHIEPYFALDNEDNIYFNCFSINTGLNVVSLDKNGNIRWDITNPVVGDQLPGLTLSPLGGIFDTPKRPRVVFYIK